MIIATILSKLIEEIKSNAKPESKTKDLALSVYSIDELIQSEYINNIVSTNFTNNKAVSMNDYLVYFEDVVSKCLLNNLQFEMNTNPDDTAKDFIERIKYSMVSKHLYNVILETIKQSRNEQTTIN